jgi:hypothetical protein
MAVIIFIGLLAIGFVFPPAWLALVGYTIYVFVSAKKRRQIEIEARLRKMIAGNVTHAVFQDVYFEAAVSYAQSCGAKANPGDKNFVLADIKLDGCSYQVGFSRDSGGGLGIFIS